MLVDLLLFILWIFELIIHTVLSAIPIHIPPEVGQSIVNLAQPIRYFGGIVDLKGTFAAFDFLLNFLSAYFTFKVLMWVLHVVNARRAPDGQSLPTQTKK